MKRAQAIRTSIAVIACVLSACAAELDNNTNPSSSGGVGGMFGVGSAGGAGGASGIGGAGGMGGFGSAGGVGGMGGAGGAVAGMGGAGGAVAGMGGVGGVGGSGGIGGGGAGGMMATGGAGGAGGTGASGMPTVTIELTTVSYDGEYAPKNYGAVWFEKADGAFVKTSKRWAGAVHASDLVAWTAASGGWGSIFGGGNTADMMDAISSATIQTHESHTITWNMKDSTAALVADGDYVAVLEMSESRARDRDGPLLRIPFTKGGSPQTVEPPDQEGFSGVVLTYTP